jgi:hypothetical protein
LRKLFKLFPRRILVAYILGLFVILFASTLVLVVGLTQTTSASYSIDSTPHLLLSQQLSILGGGSIITDKSASTIYTSHIPITIADAINSITKETSAFPLTIAYVQVDGVPMVVQGLPPIAVASFPTLSQYASIFKNSTILLGSIAASELSVKVGSIISISSPQASGKLFNLTVGGIYSTGSESDYEGVVPLSFGQQLGGDAPGFVSAIVVSGANPQNLKISGNYKITLNYTGYAGNLSVIDSSGYTHYSTEVGKLGNSSILHEELLLNLPFGLYTITLEQSVLRTSLIQFATSSNNTIIDASSSSVPSSKDYVFVQNNTGGVQPNLRNSSTSQILSPNYYNNQTSSWVFIVPSGGYVLSYGNVTTPILVFGNATFSSSQLSQTLDSRLNIQVSAMQSAATYSFSSSPVGSYTITVQDRTTKQIIFAETTTNASLSIPVQAGRSYLVSLLTSGSEVSLEQSVTVPSSADSTAVITFSVPNIPIVQETSPLASYSAIGLGAPSESALFHYLEAGAIVSTLGLFAIVFGLLIVATFIIGGEFTNSLKPELKSLAYIFPDRRPMFTMLKLPLLLISLVAALMALGLSVAFFYLFDMSRTVIFAGYGLVVYPIVYSSLLVASLAILSSIWISFSIDRRMIRIT